MASKKTTKKKPTTLVGRYVIVATQCRPWSIVAGTVLRHDGASIVLGDARMIAYYSADAHALLGCAVSGPGDRARVSPRVDEWHGHAVEQVMPCSDVARAAIEAEPWA